MDEFFVAITIIVGMGTIYGMYHARLKARASHADELFQQMSERLEQVSERIERLAERMANIETIVLEKEKEKRFDSLVG
jgi:TolA-binding protein